MLCCLSLPTDTRSSLVSPLLHSLLPASLRTPGYFAVEIVSLWRMLCHCGHLGLPSGRCFATEVCGCLFCILWVDALHHGFSFSIGNRCVDVFIFLIRLSLLVGCCGWGSPSFLLLFAVLGCFWLYTTVLVVCNMRYEGSLVVASCNSIIFNETCVKAPPRHVLKKEV